ncbi:MAG: hypothetical protein JWQ62_2167 [Lacunisphaera sp.]|nr:hypothetical protein [Lacunisphaera sp.]
MKTSPKYLVLLASLALLAAPALRAQDPATPADKPEHKRGAGGERGPGAMMERAAKELDLTADQQAKWKAIGEEERTALKALRDDTSVAKEDKRAKMKEINKTFGDQRRAALTDDQAKKFDEMRAKMGARGERGPKGEDGAKDEKKE